LWSKSLQAPAVCGLAIKIAVRILLLTDSAAFTTRLVPRLPGKPLILQYVWAAKLI
jgi:hypothetical protein